jgi:hypothetical protein
MADDHDDDPDLTDRDKELRRWSRPYEFREFPKWLHRVSPTIADVSPVDRLHDVTTTTTHDRTVQADLVHQAGIVDTAEAEADLQAAGWVTHIETARQAALEAVRREKQRRADEDKDLVKQAVREALKESLLADARHSSNESAVEALAIVPAKSNVPSDVLSTRCGPHQARNRHDREATDRAARGSDVDGR